MEINAGNIILDLFESLEISHIFSSPGSEWVPLFGEIVKRKGLGKTAIQYINCRHEELAVSMAMGFAKASGRLPAVILHDSVGPLHAAMAIRAASHAQVPMIVFGSDAYDHGDSGSVKGLGVHWLTQLSDVGGSAAQVRPFVKWSNAVRSPENLSDSIVRGCRIAVTDPKGPVYISISQEVLSKLMPGVKVEQPRSEVILTESPNGNFKDLADQLVKSQNPVIVTEYAGNDPENIRKLVELAGLLAIPVFESLDPACANFPKNHPMFMGYDPSEALQQADLVFLVGCTTPWYPPSKFNRQNLKIALLDEDSVHSYVPYWGYKIDTVLTANIARGLEALVANIKNIVLAGGLPLAHKQKRLESWSIKHNNLVERWKKEAIEARTANSISPKWCLYSIGMALPGNSIIVEETITQANLLHRYLAEPGRFIRACSGGLGLGLGVALGTKVVYPERPMVFVVGDGTFNYNPVLAGMGLCQEYQLPVLTIILNNGGYASLGKRYREFFPDLAISRNDFIGVNITPAPDYAKLAAVFGGYGENVETPDELEKALKRALDHLAQGRSALLNIILGQD